MNDERRWQGLVLFLALGRLLLLPLPLELIMLSLQVLFLPRPVTPLPGHGRNPTAPGHLLVIPSQGGGGGSFVLIIWYDMRPS